MIGQFIIPNCAAAGLRVKALVRNTHNAGSSVPLELRSAGLSVELRVYRDGELIRHTPDFLQLPLNGVGEVSDDTCSELATSQKNILIVARCSLASRTNDYFPQEHQLLFHSPETGAHSSLLYGQLPVPGSDRPSSPIVLLAPKVWIGAHINTFVVFASTNSKLQGDAQSRPLAISLHDQDGEVIVERNQILRNNATFVIDVKKEIRKATVTPSRPQLFSLTAKGGSGSFAIMSFIKNERTGNFALEHSLSPHYYVAGDLKRIRDEALVFNAS